MALRDSRRNSRGPLAVIPACAGMTRGTTISESCFQKSREAFWHKEFMNIEVFG